MYIVVVGPCASGKTTLVNALRAAGYQATAVAQEHSAVAQLWRHGGEPAVLIYLDVGLAAIAARGRLGFPAWLLEEQRRRLAAAHTAADLYLQTDNLPIEEVRSRVIAFLEQRRAETG